MSSLILPRRLRQQGLILPQRQRGFIINPFVFGGGGGGTDPNFANVSSLLHFDGANLSTSFVDVIAAPSWSRTGTPVISTAQSKFGGASGLFSGTTDRIETAAHTDLNLGTGDFTIEGWIYPSISLSGTTQCIFDNRNASNNGIAIYASVSTLSSNWCTADNATAYNSNDALILNLWTFMAICREGTTIRMYSGGVQRGNYTDSRSYTAPATRYGQDYTGGAGLNGVYLDDWRITKGVCRYPGGTTFTPPTAAFPDS